MNIFMAISKYWCEKYKTCLQDIYFFLNRQINLSKELFLLVTSTARKKIYYQNNALIFWSSCLFQNIITNPLYLITKTLSYKGLLIGSTTRTMVVIIRKRLYDNDSLVGLLMVIMMIMMTIMLWWWCWW